MREPQRSPAAHRRPAMEWAAWIAAFACVAVLLAAVGFESRDPDSALHASIVGQSFERPVTEWIAPSWGGNWTRTDLYREHPAGIFLLPSALARMGYPASQSAYLVNAVFQILTVMALTSFGRLVLPAGEARTLGWLLLVLPIAFTYRVRANHEQAILLLTIVALYIAERARTNRGWAPLLVFPAALTFLIKGVFVVPVLAGCAIWYALRRPLPGHGASAWMGLVLAAAAAVFTAAAYEWTYRRVTGGETFLGYYLPTQLGIAAAPRGTFVAQKFANVGWYAARLLWFSLPWSLFLLVEFSRRERQDGSQSRITSGRDVGGAHVAADVQPLGSSCRSLHFSGVLPRGHRWSGNRSSAKREGSPPGCGCREAASLRAGRSVAPADAARAGSEVHQRASNPTLMRRNRAIIRA